MRILLTGGRGLLGTPLAVRLESAGHEVRATDLPEVDVTNLATVERAVSEHRSECVVHLAAWTDVDGCEREPERAMHVNGDGARHAAAAAASVGASILYVSTDYVFDGRKNGGYDESDSVAPLSAYGQSKLAGERHVQAGSAPWWIVRCQSIYGSGRKSFADAILARQAGGVPVSVVTDQTVSPSYAPDLAEAIHAVIEQGEHGVYHASNTGACTWYEFARAVFDEVGLTEVEIQKTTAAEFGRPAPRPANSEFTCNRLERQTGLRPRPWRDALRAYLADTGRLAGASQ